MPDAYTLEDYMSGNTTESILECLTFLQHESERRRTTDYRISIVFGRGSRQVCVGDDLELANPDTEKTRRKRWWERIEEATDQRRLPFPLYKPSIITCLSVGRHGDEFELCIRYSVGGDNQLVTTTFTSRRGLSGSGNTIKAIKIHRVKPLEVRRPSDPFLTYYPQELLGQAAGCAPSPTQYADLITQGGRRRRAARLH